MQLLAENHLQRQLDQAVRRLYGTDGLSPAEVNASWEVHCLSSERRHTSCLCHLPASGCRKDNPAIVAGMHARTFAAAWQKTVHLLLRLGLISDRSLGCLTATCLQMDNQLRITAALSVYATILCIGSTGE